MVNEIASGVVVYYIDIFGFFIVARVLHKINTGLMIIV